ncbi:MAG: LysR substrate-binding domain-containing protein [Sumerlaeia bacterium]
MNHKQLEAIIYLSRHGNFARAAEMLYFDSDEDDYVTPETLQYRIKSLEKELGVTLYNRSPGAVHVTLTREGNLFLKEAIEFHQRIRQWRTMFHSLGQSRLAFAATELVILHRIVEPLKEFADRYPDMQIEMRAANPEEVEAMVRRGEIDFGIGTHPPEGSGLEYTVWKRSKLIGIAPKGHPLGAKEKVTLEDLSGHPLIMLIHDMSRRDDRARVDAAFHRRKIAHHDNVRMITTNSEIICCYVEAGMGVGIVPETALVNNRRELEILNLADSVGSTEVGILMREDKIVTPAMRELFQMLSPKLEEWLDERASRKEEELPAISLRSGDFEKAPS